MKYIIFGNPNEKVRRIILKRFGGYAKKQKKQFNGFAKGRLLFTFDSKGEFVTDNERLIKKIKGRFEVNPIEEENNAVPTPKVDTREEIKSDKKVLKCKKCDFETDNMGLLLAHTRKDHKKEGT